MVWEMRLRGDAAFDQRQRFGQPPERAVAPHDFNVAPARSFAQALSRLPGRRKPSFAQCGDHLFDVRRSAGLQHQLDVDVLGRQQAEGALMMRRT